jgi:hypothetical protein
VKVPEELEVVPIVVVVTVEDQVCKQHVAMLTEDFPTYTVPRDGGRSYSTTNQMMAMVKPTMAVIQTAKPRCFRRIQYMGTMINGEKTYICIDKACEWKWKTFLSISSQ